MKTIRQLAGELNVSKEAIRQKLRKLDLAKDCQIVDNKLLIDEVTESKIRAAFDKTINQNTLQSTSQSIEILKQQLAAKDQQIAALQSALQSSQTIADQAQKLQAITQQKLKALEDKEAAAGSEENKRKSLWKRIFQRGNNK